MSIIENIKLELMNLSLTDYSKYNGIYWIVLPYDKYKLLCYEIKSNSDQLELNYKIGNRQYMIYELYNYIWSHDEGTHALFIK